MSIPELEGQRVACDDLVFTLGGKLQRWTSCSLSTSQIDDDFLLGVVFFKESTNDLLDGVHSKPVPTIDEWIAPDECWSKWLVVIRLIAEI